MNTRCSLNTLKIQVLRKAKNIIFLLLISNGIFCKVKNRNWIAVGLNCYIPSPTPHLVPWSSSLPHISPYLHPPTHPSPHPLSSSTHPSLCTTCLSCSTPRSWPAACQTCRSSAQCRTSSPRRWTGRWWSHHRRRSTPRHGPAPRSHTAPGTHAVIGTGSRRGQ